MMDKISEYVQRYKRPIGGGELNQCEFIEEMQKAHFQIPKQTEKSCEGYRNQYTGDASLVCGICKWFSDNKGDGSNDGSGTDKCSS